MTESAKNFHELQIQTEQLRIAYRQLPVAVVSTLVVAIPIVWLFQIFVPLKLLLAWYVMLITVNAFRLLSVRSIKADDFDIHKISRYIFLYQLSAFLAGSTWASLALLLPIIDAEYQLVVMVMLMGVAGGALTSNSSLISAYHSYTMPIFAAIIAQAFLMANTIYYVVGIITIVYAIYMTLTSWKLSKSLYNSIVQHFMWQDTALELEKAHTELNVELKERKKAEEDLKDTQIELKNAIRHLEQVSAIDALTGIANRRSFDTALAREWSRARRENRHIALLMIDVDYFKEFNDIYGHPAGDEALKAIARVLRTYSKRAGDLSARYGGEEFALILSDAGQEYIEDLCEVLLEDISNLDIEHSGSAVSTTLSISVGAAIVDSPTSDDYSPIISAADKLLYEAKQTGRNQFKLAA